MIVFGMPTLVEMDCLEKNVELCKRLGLKFIELNMNFPEYQVSCLNDRKQLAQMAADAGIYYTIHLDENLDIAHFNPLVRKAWLETAERVMEIAREMYVPVVNMHLNRGVHMTLPGKKVFMYERNRSEYMERVIEFREKCAQWCDERVRICVENTDGWKEFEKEAIETLLQDRHIGLTWDIGHSCSAGNRDVPFLKSHLNHLNHFHIHDADPDTGKNHLALGTGNNDITGGLHIARACGARCVLETKTAEALEHSVKWLKENGVEV